MVPKTVLYILHLLKNLGKIQVSRFFFEKLPTALQFSEDAAAYETKLHQ
jgi:hypothetical protein